MVEAYGEIGIAVPMRGMGVKEREMKLMKGNQYQKWENSTSPTIDAILLVLVLILNNGSCYLEVREMVQFLPPACRSALATMAPNLQRMSSCLSL